jgi:hypothetical protein
LVEVLDRVLDKGLFVRGDIRISLAEVELLTIRIRPTLILLGAEPADRDPPDRVIRPQSAHQIEAASIGQSDVADQQIEQRLIGDVDRFPHRARHADLVVVEGEQLRKRIGAVLMISFSPHAPSASAPESRTPMTLDPYASVAVRNNGSMNHNEHAG